MARRQSAGRLSLDALEECEHPFRDEGAIFFKREVAGIENVTALVGPVTGAWQNRIVATPLDEPDPDGRTQVPVKQIGKGMFSGAYLTKSGKPYVSLVHRSGEKQPLHEIITKQVSDTLIPKLVSELALAIAADLTKPAPRRIAAAGKPSQTETLELEF